MERTIEVQHVSVEVKVDFESFTRNLEQSLGRFEYAHYDGLETEPAKVRERLEQAAGEEGLMLFNTQDHGKLLNIFGTPQKARQYVLGNPLIAITMTRHDIRAALYAPLRLLVYESNNDVTWVEYDQPSSLFGQFDDPQVTAVAQSLDTKLANLIQRADRV